MPNIDDLARAFDFILRADMAGTRTEPFRWGTAAFMPECPLRHDSNYLLVEGAAADADAAAIAGEADRLLGAVGLRHRMVMFRDAAAGERLAPGFESLGWTPSRGVVMALRRNSQVVPPPDRVRRTEATVLRAVREATILGYPWATPEVARQLLDARDHVPVETRHFAAFADGAPVSWAELYVEGDVAQVEAVATLEPFRNRGFSSAVVLACVEAARGSGAGFVFLCADADDWPRHWYRRLGFEEIGAYVKFTRHPPPAATLP